MKVFKVIVISVLLATSCLWATVEPDFSSEVLPILSDKCFACHGPDAKKKELRLDSYEEAIKDLGGYKAIDPKKLHDSEFIFRINDKEDPMPPEKELKQLNDFERDVLTRWIKSGAKYDKHWAYVRPKAHAKFNSIDEFITARLDTKKIKLASKADKPTLARRAALVLTGLPPEQNVLNKYLSNPKEEAYENLIDDLLASENYGEHQARYWLDAVRYGDTHGLHLDNKRGIYPYRDWVIKAMNENIPLNEFIKWQLAGDLLPNSTLEQTIATGYVRMNPSTSEGGVIPKEFQAKNNFDRVENFGTVFLGMSLLCARCHTHKYDPILHDEYYQLMAFFNSTSEHSLDGNSYDYKPNLQVPSNPALWKEWESFLNSDETFVKKALNSYKIDAKKVTQNKSLRDQLLYVANAKKSWSALKLSGMNKKTAEHEIEKDHAVFINKNLGKDQNTNFVTKDYTGTIRAIRLDVLKDNRLPKRGPGRNKDGNFILNKFKVFQQMSDGTKKELIIKKAYSNYSEKGYLSRNLISSKTDGRWSIKPRMNQNHYSVFVLDKGYEIKEGSQLSVELGYPDPKYAIGKFKISVSQSEYDLFANQAIELLDPARSEHFDLTTTLVAKELAQPRETFRLSRGEYDKSVGEALKPDVFSIMGKMQKSFPNNRLGLAQWLTSKDHPLTSRVLVNRIWQRVFGEGLVRTPEEFGLQGEHPTHPQLLDWIALKLQSNGWDLKQILKTMVMSETFQQSSKWRKELDDPKNKLLARGPSFRLDAEVIRDIGLWSSGMLKTDKGGEGVKPFQPKGLWSSLMHPASNTKNYIPDSGDKIYRRSIYVYWKRTSPHPMMTLFDAPSRELSCVRRSRSNTPLQSLGLLNEVQRVEMARSLAMRVLSEVSEPKERMNQLFMLLISRHPKPDERRVCDELLHKMKQRYQKDESAAMALITSGTPGFKTSLVKSELAAWTQVASTLLASDAALLLY